MRPDSVGTNWQHMASRLSSQAILFLIALLAACAQPAPEPAVRTVWQDAQDGAMISPDGKLAAFIDWNVSTVAVRDIAAGTERQLPDASSIGFPEPYFVFSPNSDRLVYPFGNNREGVPFRYELRSIDLASGVHTVLAAFPADVAFVAPLAWHDRTGIVFTTVAADGSSELLILDPVTKSARALQRRAFEAGLVWQGLFTREGNGLVVLANNALAWIDVTAGTERPLGVDAQVLLGWSTDERALFFHAVRGGKTGNWSVALSQGVPVAEPLLLQRTSPGVRWAGRDPEGVHYLEPVQTPGLFMVEIDVAAARLLSAPMPILPAPGHVAANPVWSRAGSRLAYTLGVPNRIESRVFVADSLRGVAREIAALDLRVTGLDWSADGRFIIVGGRALTRDRAWIGRIDVATGSLEKLVVGAPASTVAAGAGEDVFFTQAALAGSRSVHVKHVRGAGAVPRVLATYTIDDLPRSMSVAPDGKWVAILKAIPEARASALILVPTAGGEPRTVLQLQRPDALELNQGSVPWMADGRGVVVLLRREGRRHLAVVRVDSGDITALSFSPREGGRRNLALHPDGRHLVYVDGAGRYVLKVMLVAQ
jgi:hypothetical protein